MTKNIEHSLHPIFSPQSVAVVGASTRRDSIGYCIVDNLLTSHFNGLIYPINRTAESIHSLKCYPSLQSIPDPVDLAIISVPKDMVDEVIDDCLEKGVKGVVVVTAGFKETGREGLEQEKELIQKIKASGMRMIGPNCMGIINADPKVSLNATFAPTPARKGHVGFVSQSGALGVAILNVAEKLGLGLTQFVSMGNKADVSANDLLEYWEDDEDTRVIAMYLESFGHPREFAKLAKRVGQKKPILVVKSGRTREGARAASSHTGALAGTDITVSTFLESCGVLRVETIQELFDTARALESFSQTAGNHVGIITNAGGPGIMATDSCVNLGLEIPVLSQQTQDFLGEFLPKEASFINPVDMIASAGPENYEKAVRTVLWDSGVDMAIVIFVTPLLANPIQILESIAKGAEDAPPKPLLTVIMASEDFYHEAKNRPDLPPVYQFPESAARSLSKIYRYSLWKKKMKNSTIPTFEVDDKQVAQLLSKQKEGYLEAEDAFKILELYGIATASWKIVKDLEEAKKEALSISYPLVLKGISPNLIHKSDVSGVKVGIQNEEELEKAFLEMTKNLTKAGYTPTSYLLQEYITKGHEVVFGTSGDPKFGSLLMFGLGGRYVEVLKDVCFAIPPLSCLEAEDMIRGIHGFPILEGTRGEEGADLNLLKENLIRLGQLVTRHPSIQELDINPFMAGMDLDSAKVVDVRIRVGENSL